eukprot:765328-Hanusia_phi.AAC.8
MQDYSCTIRRGQAETEQDSSVETDVCTNDQMARWREGSSRYSTQMIHADLITTRQSRHGLPDRLTQFRGFSCFQHRRSSGCAAPDIARA